MRTTLSLDDDVAIALRKLQARSGATWKDAVNDVLRAGLAARGRTAPQVATETRPVALGRPSIGDIGNVHEALSLVEGDVRR